MARYGQLILLLLLCSPFAAFAGGWGAASCPVSAKCNQGHASASCDAQIADFKGAHPDWTYIEASCRMSGGAAGGQYDPVIDGRPAGGSRTTLVGDTEYFATLCSALPSLTSTFKPKSGSISCNDGCEQAWFANPDGTSTAQYIGTTCNTTDFPNKCGPGFYWNGYLNVCEPTKEECPQGQVPNSVGKCAPEPCPDGMVQQQDGTCKAKENECPQGQTKGPDGSCVKKPDACSAGQAMGADGTCKPDKDGDGKPDDEDSDDDGKDDKSSFSGGDSCDSPPSCSGDPIMCGQARIQWRIDCNTRRNRNISGGACSTPPICTGDKCDAMEYASLLVQWRTACAVEKLAGGKGTDNSGDQPAWTKVAGMSQDPGAGSSPDDTKVLTVNKISTDSLDQSGFGGGSCVGFGGGGSGALSKAIGSTFATPPPIWCDYMAKLKAGLIVVASCVAAFILARGAT
ncbi:hypothetical protein [Xanthomonas sacchari]|nr:hypothetical protein [Xanthomonas sacchari]MDV0438276.1 hypothetical protein [Xanthomonas sacchari]